MSSRRLLLRLDAKQPANRIEFSGRLLVRSALRHTPVGIPVIEFRLAHESRQEEAGGARRVECELGCIAIGNSAGILNSARLGDAMTVKGFLAAKSVGNKSPVLHVEEIEFQEGIENGS